MPSYCTLSGTLFVQWLTIFCSFSSFWHVYILHQIWLDNSAAKVQKIQWLGFSFFSLPVELPCIVNCSLYKECEHWPPPLYGSYASLLISKVLVHSVHASRVHMATTSGNFTENLSLFWCWPTDRGSSLMNFIYVANHVHWPVVVQSNDSGTGCFVQFMMVSLPAILVTSLDNAQCNLTSLLLCIWCHVLSAGQWAAENGKCDLQTAWVEHQMAAVKLTQHWYRGQCLCHTDHSGRVQTEPNNQVRHAGTRTWNRSRPTCPGLTLAPCLPKYGAILS